MPFMTLVCLLFTACNKDDILPGGPMLWTYEILTPESVEYEGGTVGWIPKECFKANGNEGYIVMTCKNFDMLNPISGGSYTYDCGWATLKVEANQLKIHFPRQVRKPRMHTRRLQSRQMMEREQQVQLSVCLEPLRTKGNPIQSRNLCPKKPSSR